MKIGKKQSFFFFICFLFFAPVAWSSVGVEVTIDQSEILLQEQAHITISVKSEANQNLGRLKLPDKTGLKFVLSNSKIYFQTIKGQLFKIQNYECAVIADDIGEYVIPPFSISDGQNTYQSGSLRLKVISDTNSLASSQNSNTQPIPPDPFSPLQQKQKIPAQPRGDFWVESEVNKTSVVRGEQIIYKFKIYTRVEITGEKLEMPEFKDFWLEDLVPEKRGYEIIGNERFVVVESSYALFPLKEGVFEIEPARYTIRYEEPVSSQQTRQLGPFTLSFGTRYKSQTKVLSSASHQIEVKTWPEPLPRDFSGLVGHFEMASETPASVKIKQGDPINYKLKIEGQGNIKLAELPFVNFPGFKVYEEKPTTDIIKSSLGVSGAKNFSWTLVPQKSGALEISAITVSYFDPASLQYKQLSVPAAVIEVENTSGVAAPPPVDPVVVPTPSLSTDNVVQNSSSTRSFSWLEKLNLVMRHQDDWFYLFFIGGLGCLVLFSLREKIWPRDVVAARRAMKKAKRELYHLKVCRENSAVMLKKLKNYFQLLSHSSQERIEKDMTRLCIELESVPYWQGDEKWPEVAELWKNFIKDLPQK